MSQESLRRDAACCVSTRGLTQGLRNTKTFPSVIPTDTGSEAEWRDPDSVSHVMPHQGVRTRTSPSPSSRALYQKRSFVLSSQLFFLCSRPQLLIPINRFFTLVPISRSLAGANATKGASEMGTDPWGRFSNYFWARRMLGLSLSSAGGVSRS
jgi:hypothetical protein